LYITIQFSPVYGIAAIIYSFLTGIFFFALGEIIERLKSIVILLEPDEESEEN